VEARQQGAGDRLRRAARTFVVDRTAPVFAIETAPTLGNGGWTNAATLTVSVAVTENNRNQASESVSVSGCAGPSGSSPYVFVCSAEGLKSLSASGQDAAGNPATPVLASYYVDRTAPTTSVEAASPAAGAPVRGTFTVSALVDDNFKGLGAGSLADTSLANATVTGPCAAAASAAQRQRLTSGPDVDKVRVSVVFATSAAHEPRTPSAAGATEAACSAAFPVPVPRGCRDVRERETGDRYRLTSR
jgi:hypothetical protein